MRLSEAELAEGRRLWEDMLKLPDEDYSLDEYVRIVKGWGDFARKNMPALLGRREEIAREAVREFAEAVVNAAGFDYRMQAEIILRSEVEGLAAARGATLDEKP